MNEVIKTLLERRAVRKYQDKPVSREDLELIVKCGQYAATGMGRQPWHFAVVTDPAILQKITDANAALVLDDPKAPPHMKESVRNGSFNTFRGAPCAVLVSGDGTDSSTIADCANAVENMAIAAKSLGLDSCYLASHQICLNHPSGGELKKLLGVPEGYTPNFALAIGYGDMNPVAAPRREGTVTWL